MSIPKLYVSPFNNTSLYVQETRDFMSGSNKSGVITNIYNNAQDIGWALKRIMEIVYPDYPEAYILFLINSLINLGEHGYFNFKAPNYEFKIKLSVPVNVKLDKKQYESFIHELMIVVLGDVRNREDELFFSEFEYNTILENEEEDIWS